MIERAFTISSKMGVRFILPVTIRMRFSLLQTIEGINFGLVKIYVTPYRIFWILFTSDLVITYTDKIVGFPIGKHCASLVADLFFLFCYERFFMTSLLFLMIIKPILLRHLTQPLDI